MNAKVAVLCVVGFLALRCGVERTSQVKKTEQSALSLNIAEESTESAAMLSAVKLREHCRACHAVGNLRFIFDDNDQNLWVYILTKQVPGKSELWANAIVRVLSWPTDSAPTPSPMMDPPSGRDWMPKGSKRLNFAADRIDDMAVRQYILHALNAELTK